MPETTKRRHNARAWVEEHDVTQKKTGKTFYYWRLAWRDINSDHLTAKQATKKVLVGNRDETTSWTREGLDTAAELLRPVVAAGGRLTRPMSDGLREHVEAITEAETAYTAEATPENAAAIHAARAAATAAVDIHVAATIAALNPPTEPDASIDADADAETRDNNQTATAA